MPLRQERRAGQVRAPSISGRVGARTDPRWTCFRASHRRRRGRRRRGCRPRNHGRNRPPSGVAPDFGGRRGTRADRMRPGAPSSHPVFNGGPSVTVTAGGGSRAAPGADAGGSPVITVSAFGRLTTRCCPERSAISPPRARSPRRVRAGASVEALARRIPPDGEHRPFHGDQNGPASTNHRRSRFGVTRRDAVRVRGQGARR